MVNVLWFPMRLARVLWFLLCLRIVLHFLAMSIQGHKLDDAQSPYCAGK